MMHVGWKLVWINAIALTVNALFLLLAVLHVCPVVLPILLFAGCLAGLVWLSCRIQGKTLGRKP
jgi:hypothetical protein